VEDLDFADDIALLSHSHKQMQEKTTRLEQIAAHTKLSWSEAESKAQDRAEWWSIVGGCAPAGVERPTRRSSSALVLITVVALHRAQLILGWVTDRLWAGRPSWYVTTHLVQLSLPSPRGR